MKPKTVKGIVIEFWREAQGTSMYPNKQGDKQVTEALASIRELIEKEKKPTCEAYQGDRKHLLLLACVQGEIDRNISYNQAIDRILKLFEE